MSWIWLKLLILQDFESLSDHFGAQWVKSVQIRSFFGSVFSRIQTWKKVLIWTHFTQWCKVWMKWLKCQINLKAVTYINTNEIRFWKEQMKYLYKRENCRVLVNVLTGFGAIMIIYKKIQCKQYNTCKLFYF